MIINFDEEKFINAIVKEMLTVEDIYLDDISEAVFEDLESWFANYGLHTELMEEIVKRIEDMNIEIIK